LGNSITIANVELIWSMIVKFHFNLTAIITINDTCATQPSGTAIFKPVDTIAVLKGSMRVRQLAWMSWPASLGWFLLNLPDNILPVG